MPSLFFRGLYGILGIGGYVGGGMDNFYRVMILFALLAMYAGWASAYEVAADAKWEVTTNTRLTAKQDTKELACEDYLLLIAGSGYAAFVKVANGLDSYGKERPGPVEVCVYSYPPGGSFDAGYGPGLGSQGDLYKAETCPVGGTPLRYDGAGSGRVLICSIAACPAGTTLGVDNVTCEKPSPCEAQKNATYSGGYYDIGTSPSGAFSNSGCTASGCGVTFQGSVPAARALVAGTYHYYAQGSFDFDGFQCTSGGVPSSVAGVPSDSCGPGSTLSVVNDVKACVVAGAVVDPNAPPVGATTDTSTTSTVTDPVSGSTTSTTSTLSSDGGTTRTTTVTATDGTVTTTVLTLPGVGAGSGAGTDPLASFCASNPSTPLCKTSSWGGSCGAFACDGDAVQCAIAREQHTRNCALFVTETPESILGKQVASGADPLASTLPDSANPTVVDVGVGMSAYTSQTWLSRADLPSPSFSAMGSTFTLDTSLLSQFMRIVGFMLVAVSGIVGARIIGGVS